MYNSTSDLLLVESTPATTILLFNCWLVISYSFPVLLLASTEFFPPTFSSHGASFLCPVCYFLPHAIGVFNGMQETFVLKMWSYST